MNVKLKIDEKYDKNNDGILAGSEIYHWIKDAKIIAQKTLDEKISEYLKKFNETLKDLGETTLEEYPDDWIKFNVDDSDEKTTKNMKC